MPLNLQRIRQYLDQLWGGTLPIKHQQQPGDNLCWATCYKMVDEWKNNSSSGICHYVQIQQPKCPQCSDTSPKWKTCDQPRVPSLFLNDWQQCLGFVNTIHKNKPLNITEIRKEIKNGKPVQAYLTYRGNPDSAHTFLIVGTSRIKETLDTAIIVADPLNDKITMMCLSDLAVQGDWSQTWIVEA